METRRVLDVTEFIDAVGIRPRQWSVVLLCSLVALLDGLDVQSIGLAAPLMGPALHIPPQLFGFVFSAALAGLALGAFALGPVADRIGRKSVLIASMICFGAFTLATALSTQFTDLIVYRFLAGVGLGGAMPSFISLASEYVPSPRRAAIVSLLWAGFPLGGTVGGLIGSRLIPIYGWHSIFLVGGIAPLVLAVVLVAALPESVAFLAHRGGRTERIRRILSRMFPGTDFGAVSEFVVRQEGTRKGSVRLLFADGRAGGTILLWIAFFFAFMALVTNSAWTPLLLRNLGISVADSAFALAAYNFASVFGSAAAGVLIARFGAPLILTATITVGAGAYAMIGWSAPSVGMIVGAEALFGLLLGCGSSGLIGLGATFYPSAIRSTGIGWATGIGRVGSFTGPLIVGSLVTVHLPEATIFMVVASLTVAGALACLLMGTQRPVPRL